MANVIAHNLTDKKTGNENTYHRVHKIKPIERVRVKISCEDMLYEMGVYDFDELELDVFFIS